MKTATAAPSSAGNRPPPHASWKLRAVGLRQQLQTCWNEFCAVPASSSESAGAADWGSLGQLLRARCTKAGSCQSDRQTLPAKEGIPGGEVQTLEEGGG